MSVSLMMDDCFFLTSPGFLTKKESICASFSSALLKEHQEFVISLVSLKRNKKHFFKKETQS